MTTVTEVPESATKTMGERRHCPIRAIIRKSSTIEVALKRLRTHLERKLAKQLLTADHEVYEDDMIGARSEANDLRHEHEALLYALERSVVVPWPVRPAHADSVPTWQRLRLLEALGRLRRSEARRLHVLGYTLASYEYWRWLPVLDRDRVIAPIGVRMETSYGERVRVLRLPEWVRRKRAAAQSAKNKQLHTVSRAAQHERGKLPEGEPAQPVLSEARPGKHGGVGDPLSPNETGAAGGSVQVPPTNGHVLPRGGLPPLMLRCPKTARETPLRDVFDEVEVDLPVRYLDLRDDIGDHGLYVLHLLFRRRRASDEARGGRKLEHADGWRPLSMHILRRILGTVREGGRSVYRASILIGTRSSPGLLERLGLIERRKSYCAGELSQRYRLTDCDRSEATERVTLTLRRAGLRQEGQEVPEWLTSSYSLLELSYHAAVYDLCEQAGVPPSPYADVVSAAIAALPAPAPVYTNAGALAKVQPPDPRNRWQSDLRALRDWADPGAAGRHDLYRAASNQRLQSPLASLPSWARRHLRLAGQPVAILDMRAAQLALLAARLRDEGLVDEHDDVEAFCGLCEGTEDPYGALYRLAYDCELSEEARDGWKRRLCSDLLYGSDAALARSEIGRTLAERHPNVYAWLVAEKRERGKSGFACTMQATEAEIVLDRLSPRFAHEMVPVATIHDALIVRVGDVDKAERLFAATLTEAGVTAVLRREDPCNVIVQRAKSEVVEPAEAVVLETSIAAPEAELVEERAPVVDRPIHRFAWRRREVESRHHAAQRSRRHAQQHGRAADGTCLRQRGGAELSSEFRDATGLQVDCEHVGASWVGVVRCGAGQTIRPTRDLDREHLHSGVEVGVESRTEVRRSLRGPPDEVPGAGYALAA